MIELHLKLSNEEKTLKKKKLHYEMPLLLDDKNPAIREFVQEGLREFGEPDADVLLVCKWVLSRD